MRYHAVYRRVLVVLALSLCVLLPPASSAGTTNGISTSECLGLPTEAVQDWKFLYPCCFDVETCEDACKNWSRTCNDIARVAFQCQYQSSRELTDLFKGSECDTTDDKDASKACEKQAASDLRETREFLDQDLRAAKETCFECFFDCLNFCSD